MPTKPSSSGWAPATSFEDVTCRPSAPSCSRALSWTVYPDSGLVMDRRVSKLCQVSYFNLRLLRTVRRSLTKEIATHTSPRIQYASGQSLHGSPVRVSFLSSRQASVRVDLDRSAGPGRPNVQPDIKCHPRRASLASNLRRIDFKIALMVCHCLVGYAPEYPMELCHILLAQPSHRQCLRSASRGDLVVPRFRFQTFGHWAFAVSGPQIWNSLPLRISQSCDNLLLFKQKLKAHLFQQF